MSSDLKYYEKLKSQISQQQRSTSALSKNSGGTLDQYLQTHQMQSRFQSSDWQPTVVQAQIVNVNGGMGKN